jgi:hypothetical protein
LLAGAGAALLFGAGAPALAQDAPDQEVRPSRISPIQPGLMSPPAPRLVPRPGAPSRDDGPGELATMAGFVEGARLCMAAVSPQFEVRPRILTDEGWAFMAPRQVSLLGRSYEMVQYSKGGRAIALMDDGSQVVCRLLGRVEDLAQLSQVRESLIAGLGAVPIDEAPGLETLVAGMRRAVPQADFANILIAGGYSLELAREERNVGVQAMRVIIVTSMPLPAQFQTHAPTSAAE